MKRRFRRILLYLFLGAIINVAVAWVCAWTLPINAWDLRIGGRAGADAENWYDQEYATWGRRFIKTRISAWRGDSAAADRAIRSLLLDLNQVRSESLFRDETAPPVKMLERLDTAAGFPWLAMSCFADVGADGSLTSHRAIALHRGRGKVRARFDRIDRGLRDLPLRPIWGGMIVNTLTYAVVVFLVLAVIRLIRHRVCITVWRTLLACIVISIVFGGLSTVLSAWWCAYYIDVGTVDAAAMNSGWTVYQDSSTGGARSHMAWRRTRPGAERYFSLCYDIDDSEGYVGPGLAPEVLPTWTDYLTPGSGVEMSRRADARGWPFLAMWTAMDYGVADDNADADSTGPEIHHGITLPRYDDEGALRFEWSRFLPLAPIWPGFLINMLILGPPWGVLLYACVGPRLIRRAIRRRRGRCQMCGYDLRRDFNAGCPECGWGRDPGAEVKS